MDSSPDLRPFLRLCPLNWRFPFVVLLLAGNSTIVAQDADLNVTNEGQPVASQVSVAPVQTDAAIAGRLNNIFESTGWFSDVQVSVVNGVVFLRGEVDSTEHQKWAEQLTQRTENVVAVVNELTLTPRPAVSLEPAWAQFRDLADGFVRFLPYMMSAVVVLLITLFAMRAAAGLSRRLLRQRKVGLLLRDIVSRAAAILVFLVGIYLVFRVAGLTGLAATILGGTGLIGLALGFALRDIAENFLASILLSVQQPFAKGDLIEIAGYTGLVQKVSMRSTLLMDLDGNHVQLPNSTIYKGILINFTANPNERQNFSVGIGYDDEIARAQQIAIGILRAHTAVLEDPEPLVLVESLGAATVNLRVYFWINVELYGRLKVKSSVIRQIKLAFDQAEISMPDEAREVVFPAGVPVIVESEVPRVTTHDERKAGRSPVGSGAAATTGGSEGEGDLGSDTRDLKTQAENSRDPEGGRNLLT